MISDSEKLLHIETLAISCLLNDGFINDKSKEELLEPRLLVLKNYTDNIIKDKQYNELAHCFIDRLITNNRNKNVTLQI